MKKIKYLLLFLVFFQFISLIGCTTTGNTGEYLFKELDAPINLRIVNYEDLHILFFDEVEDAIQYDVRVFKGGSTSPMAVGKVTFEDVIEGYILEKIATNERYETGEYRVAVRAIADKNTRNIDSKYSEKISFTVVNKTDDEECAVIFDTNGGSSIPPQIVKKGECAIEPERPTKDGYEFVCWLSEGLIFSFTTPILSDTTLVASWKEKSQGTTIELTDYYQSLLDSTGSLPAGNALKLKLREIISTGVKSTTYDQLRNSNNGLGYTDADPEIPGNLILFYSQQSVSAKWDSGNTWNREHVIPKSIGWGYYESGPGSDIHHIRPTDSRVNSTRSNLKIGKVTNGKEVKYNGLVVATYDSNYFEPLDSVKGDVARIYLYMITRYSDADSWNITRAAESLELLLEWNRLDPVSEFERLRNERSYQIQNNRNPFIDYPEFVDMIWG